MLEPCFPENEAERLSVLNSLNVLDSNSVESWIASRGWPPNISASPLRWCSLIDRSPMVFIALWLDARETPRNISFCGHAILQRETLVVPDTAKRSALFR